MNSAKFLHDGFFDTTGRYFQIAANASDKMVIVDTKERKLEAMIDVDKSLIRALAPTGTIPSVVL